MSDEESFVILGNCSPTPSFEVDEDYSKKNSSMPRVEEKKDVPTVQPEMADTHTKVTNSSDVMVLSDGTLQDIPTYNNGEEDMAGSSETVKGIQTSSSSSNDGQDMARSGGTVWGIQARSSSSNGGQSMACSGEAVSSNGQDMQRNAGIEKSLEANIIGNSNGQVAAKVMQASSSNGQLSSLKKSLAASFILGEIPADVLKTSVYSQFPSVCSSIQSCPEEFKKFQCFWDQYILFKDVTTKFISITKDLQSQLSAQKTENLDLKRNINLNVEQMEICEKIRQTDHTNLLQTLSEKTSQISNMQSHIEKLQEQHLASYEFVSKLETDTKNKPDYIERLEHERIVKDMDSKMSKLLADNLSTKDMEKQYFDEINCLKVNLTAAEELINQNRADISILNARDMEKSEQILLLRQQIDVYCKDFEMERNARQSIAGEKDQLLQDLRALQRKNQELIEEAQKQYESIEKCTASAANIRTGLPASVNAAITNAALYERNSPQRPIRELPTTSRSSNASNADILSSNYDTHRCPVCFRIYKSLSLLQSHVNMCLDGKRD